MEVLTEHLTYDQAKVEVLSEGEGNTKSLCMKGIFIQGDVRNHNNRVYPLREITKAVESMNDRIKGGFSILGEADHPTELTVHVKNVSHVITEMWMDQHNGMGKLKLLPTPNGQIVRSLLESGIKLGVSSRGQGNVINGAVSDFEIITVDIVAQPSAPEAFPTPIYEGLWRNSKSGKVLDDLVESVRRDPKAQKYLREEIIKFIDELKFR